MSNTEDDVNGAKSSVVVPALVLKLLDPSGIKPGLLSI